MSEFFTHLINGDIESMLNLWGIFILLFMVFFESGIVLGIIFPGDLLLFTAWVLTAEWEIFTTNVWLLAILLIIASIAGNMAWFITWKRVGEWIKKRIKKNGKFFFINQETMDNVQVFYEKWLRIDCTILKNFVRRLYPLNGEKVWVIVINPLIVAKFFPVIRTLIPIVWGMTQIKVRNFFLFSTLWSIVRVLVFFVWWYFLGKRFDWIVDYIEYIALGILVLTNTTVIYKWRKYRIQERIMKRIKKLRLYWTEHISKAIRTFRLKKQTKKVLKVLNKQKIPFQLAQTLKKKKET